MWENEIFTRNAAGIPIFAHEFAGNPPKFGTNPGKKPENFTKLWYNKKTDREGRPFDGRKRIRETAAFGRFAAAFGGIGRTAPAEHGRVLRTARARGHSGAAQGRRPRPAGARTFGGAAPACPQTRKRLLSGAAPVYPRRSAPAARRRRARPVFDEGKDPNGNRKAAGVIKPPAGRPFARAGDAGGPEIPKRRGPALHRGAPAGHQREKARFSIITRSSKTASPRSTRGAPSA